MSINVIFVASYVFGKVIRSWFKREPGVYSSHFFVQGTDIIVAPEGFDDVLIGFMRAKVAEVDEQLYQHQQTETETAHTETETAHTETETAHTEPQGPQGREPEQIDKEDTTSERDWGKSSIT